MGAAAAFLSGVAHRHAPRPAGFRELADRDEPHVLSRRRSRDAIDAGVSDRAASSATSLGGMVALDFALESPERVSALVLVGAGTDDHDCSEEMEAFDAAEEAALERGDLEAAVNANLDFWVAGPRRTLDEIDPKIRELVGGDAATGLRAVRRDTKICALCGSILPPRNGSATYAFRRSSSRATRSRRHPRDRATVSRATFQAPSGRPSPAPHICRTSSSRKSSTESSWTSSLGRV